MPPPAVTFARPLAPAAFLNRPNRFVVSCRLEADGATVDAHLPDPGRLRELLVPGRRLWLQPAPSRPGGRTAPNRRTRWTATLVEAPDDGGLVSLDTTLPNRLVAGALRHGAMPEFAGWSLRRGEVPIGGSRFDFLLARGRRSMALEVKSVTLVADGVARFPDAVTARGARHLRELAQLAGRRGWAGGVLFVAQRADPVAIRAAPDIDPTFAAALDEARRAGVTVLGRRCVVTTRGVSLADPIPVG